MGSFQFNSGVKSDIGPTTTTPRASPRTLHSSNIGRGGHHHNRKSLPRNNKMSTTADTYGKPYQYGVAHRGYHSLGSGVMRANRAAKKAAAALQPPTSPGSYGVAISIKGIKGGLAICRQLLLEARTF